VELGERQREEVEEQQLEQGVEGEVDLVEGLVVALEHRLHSLQEREEGLVVASSFHLQLHILHRLVEQVPLVVVLEEVALLVVLLLGELLLIIVPPKWILHTMHILKLPANAYYLVLLLVLRVLQVLLENQLSLDIPKNSAS